MADYPDFEGGKRAIMDFSVWAADRDKHKLSWGSASVNDGTLTQVLSYTVPTGYKLYVTDWGAYILSENGIVAKMDDYGGVLGTPKVIGGGYMGFFSPIATPVTIVAGNACRIFVYHKAGAAKTCEAIINGFLLDV